MVELAYLNLEAKVPTPISLRVKPPIPIEFGASAVNHISNRMVEKLKPFGEHRQYAAIKKELEAGIIVAHNAEFDMKVLWREGIDISTYVCTKQMAQKMYPDAAQHRLQYLRYFLDLDVEGAAHTADGDIAVLKALFDRMIKDGAKPERFTRSV